MGSQKEAESVVAAWVCARSLHIIYILWLLAFCLYGTPKSGSRCTSDSFAYSDPFAPIQIALFILPYCTLFYSTWLSALGGLNFAEEKKMGGVDLGDGGG